MEFEKHKSLSELLGEKLGFLLGVGLFATIAFFVIGKTGVLCWSLENFARFAGSILLIYLIIEIIRRLSGRNANKIVS
ncbi:hypothetical protein HY484_04370 [Candidatus Woesearchaeota archaeon]|nr:hypothetical protein [Candidatus Woesearchaeota archaeon]